MMHRAHALSDLFARTSAEPHNLIQRFKNPDADRVIESVILQAIEYMRDAGVSDFDMLGKRASTYWEGGRRTAFGHGDIWFGSVLVHEDEGDGCPRIGICDWEFTGPNHPAADIAQIGSYLHLASISPLTTSPVSSILLAFSESLYKVYQTRLGRLIQNSCAHWWCDCPGEGVRCDHIVAMVKTGAQLLRAAGNGGENNWSVDWKTLEDIPWCRFLGIFHNRAA